MDERSEPTTGEIVRNFRGACIFGITESLERAIIDRLESQEREIAELTGKNEWSGHACDHIINKLRDELRAMTARAEQAEADIKKFAHTSHTCGHNESGLCKLAADDHGFCEKCPAWVYRGQPQDGEGL